MAAPYEYDYTQPVEVPDARGDLEFIRDVAQAAIGDGEHTGLFPFGSIADGEIACAPMGDGGFAVTVGPSMDDYYLGEVPESTSSSRTLVFDGSLRVVRAVVEVGSDLAGESGRRYTKRVPRSAASAFVTSMAASIRDEL
jgi:hypothetical protein